MIRIGVISTASIAERRMIPAILKAPEFRYAGAAIADREETGGLSEEEFAPVWARRTERARTFEEKFGGRTYCSFREMLDSPEIDAVYLPLPPALHTRWAREAIARGKHVLMEKPFTTALSDTRALTEAAGEKRLALAENYGFLYHRQTRAITEALRSGRIGELRSVRISFGFPHRDAEDFRYRRRLGGGALLDCGGYTIRLASLLLGESARMDAARLCVTPGHEVDIFGNCMMSNSGGMSALLSFGMDNHYRCELELWGSAGCILAPRIFTAPDGFEAPVEIRTAAGTETRTYADDQFLAMLERFAACAADGGSREEAYAEILRESALTDDCARLSAQR